MKILLFPIHTVESTGVRSAKDNMKYQTRDTGGKKGRKREPRIRYDARRRDRSIEEDAPVWERSAKEGAWRPINLSDPAVNLPPFRAFVPSASATVTKNPMPTVPDGAPHQSPLSDTVRPKRIPSLTISRSDTRSLLLDHTETETERQVPDYVIIPLVMDEELLKALSRRGKAAYCCPLMSDCKLGGVDREGNWVIFRHNSAFR